MSLNTILLDFTLSPNATESSLEISTKIEQVLNEFLPKLKPETTLTLETGLFKLYTSEGVATVTLRITNSGLLTINIEYPKGNHQSQLFPYERCKSIERALTDRAGFLKGQALVPIQRGTFKRYYPSSDDRLLEYDIDELVFDQKTPYQRVQIVHSKTLGNMLVLDDLQNISESDLIYTETLMARGLENYENKEILILGGGDGALLYELLKERPKQVVMLEIDDVVMSACAKHMRSICGDVLDNLSGDNYQIIIGDCMKTIARYIKDGRRFDYIFGDLTDVPISETPTGEVWQFIGEILNVSFKILKADGKFMTHVTGAAASDALKMYEGELSKLKPSVKFTTSKAFVPSFLEEWVFYQIFLDKKQ